MSSPRIPLNIGNTRHGFLRCKTEKAAADYYEHTLNTFGDKFTDKEKAVLRALYERRVWEINNQSLSLIGRSRRNGMFITDGEDG